MPHHFSEQDIAVIRDELLPFWAGRTFRESLADAFKENILSAVADERDRADIQRDANSLADDISERD